MPETKPKKVPMKSIKVPLDVHKKVKRLCADAGDTIEAFTARILQAAVEGELVAPQSDTGKDSSGDPYLAKAAKVLRRGHINQIKAFKGMLDAFSDAS
jgi:hypothetical protein